jgi:putative SOS response-associated peptidase YedK
MKLLPLYTIATAPQFWEDLWNIPIAYTTYYQARPGMRLPVFTLQDGKINCTTAVWGLPPFHAPDFYPMHRVLKNRPWNILIRQQRCAVPMNCFFGGTVQSPWLLRVLQHRAMLMGGVITTIKEQSYFTLLTTEAADVIHNKTEIMPVLFDPEKTLRWLKTKHISTVMHYADRSGSYWFDYFRVPQVIMHASENKREWLIPQGMTLQNYREREKKIQAVAFEEERANRRSGK